MGCPLLDGGFDTVPTGDAVHSRIRHNTVLGTSVLGAFVFGSDGTTLKDNATSSADRIRRSASPNRSCSHSASEAPVADRDPPCC